MALNPQVYIDNQRIVDTQTTTEAFLIGPVVVTTDNGTKLGDIQQKTCTFSIYDQSNNPTKGLRTPIVNVRVVVAGIPVFDGKVTDITVTPARRRHDNPGGWGHEAQITAATPNKYAYDYKLQGIESETRRDGGLTPMINAGNALLEKANIPGNPMTFADIPTPQRILNTQINVTEMQTQSRSVSELATLIAQTQGARVIPDGKWIRLSYSQMNLKNAIRIPATVVLENVQYHYLNIKDINNLTVLYDMPGKEIGTLVWNDFNHQERYGVQSEQYDFRIIGQDSATTFGNKLFWQNPDGWGLKQFTINLYRWERLGHNLADLMRKLYQYAVFLPSVWVDRYVLVNLPSYGGGVVAKTTLQINPSEDPDSDISRANLTIELQRGDLTPEYGLKAANQWVTNPFTWLSNPYPKFRDN